MKASTVNVIRAAWLDPFSPVDVADRAQLEAAGISLDTISLLSELTQALRRAHVLVIRLGDDVELLREVQILVSQLKLQVPILCRVDRRRMSVAVEAMRMGALHVLPVDEWAPKAWHAALDGVQRNETCDGAKSFVFVDPVSQHLFALAQRVAQTEVTALLVGPTGAGKEVLARVLHESSPRAKGPFVALNCAALPEHLIEDMLFGHEKGAFTGALKEHKGLFEQAHGGTIFLDEIGEMPMNLQAKLLRVLQEKKLNRLGGEAMIDLDVRVIAATNKDLKLAIEQREFREDLYFRISTFRLRIQPLRERTGDIMPLVMLSLQKHVDDGVPFTVSPDAKAMLESYAWPGNVRELENVVQRAVVLSGCKIITSAHLMFDDASLDDHLMPHRVEVLSQADEIQRPLENNKTSISAKSSTESEQLIKTDGIDRTALPVNLDYAVKLSEHQMIMAAIQSTASRNEAAAKLGISPRTLRYKMAQIRNLGITEGASA